MKYIVSARTTYPVGFESVELEADDEDELRGLIVEELQDAITDVEIVIEELIKEEGDE